MEAPYHGTCRDPCGCVHGFSVCISGAIRIYDKSGFSDQPSDRMGSWMHYKGRSHIYNFFFSLQILLNTYLDKKLLWVNTKKYNAQKG